MKTNIIIQCEKCNHQYRVHEKRVGEKFHCFCGHLLAIPSVKIHDAAVVRCSSCGGARGPDQEPFCRYCGSSFTLHEQDLNTICPCCFTRISSKSKFCHSCATPIIADQDEFEDTELKCPSCDDSLLHSRKMQDHSFTLKECNQCAGIWISAKIFKLLEKKAQAQAASGIHQENIEQISNSAKENSNPTKYYRKCPECEIMMHRKNYAKSSGIVVDVCSDHGIWFDIHELDEILNFIRSGELLRHHQKTSRKAQQQLNKIKIAQRNTKSTTQTTYTTTSTSTNVDFFAEIISWIID